MPDQRTEIVAGNGKAVQGGLLIQVGLWAGAAAIAVFLALLALDSAYVEGQYIPQGNDAFYHARRILDAAVGERGFYQFEQRMHVPDGAWIPWPWAYDFLLAYATKFALWMRPATDPLGFLSYVPVAWVAVNAALFLAACSAVGLSMTNRAIALLAFALSPLIQFMHMIGNLDHHFIELTFALLVSWLGLRWFSEPNHWRLASFLGLALGLAPAFHNGLFVLQIPVLVCVVALWLRGRQPASESLRALAITLVTSTAFILVPSQAFREGLFEFGLLSWFHLYAAVCTSAVLLFMGWRNFSSKTLMMLVCLSLLLSLPLLAQLTRGAAFLARDITVLGDIVEARSPYNLFVEHYGPLRTVALYSWLLLLAPILLLYFLWDACRKTQPRDLFFSLSAAFGLAFLLTQFRFYYFGLFALIAGTLVVVERLSKKFDWHQGMTAVALLGGLLVTYQPPLRQQLFTVLPVGLDRMYELMRPAILDLSERCRQEPGLILADHDDGNPLLFHTECSVVANNFILRPEDERNIAEIGRMMQLSPEELRRSHPEVDYLLLRARDFSVMRNGKLEISASNPLAKGLLLDAEPPEGFELIRSVSDTRNGRTELIARAYAVN